MPQNYYNSLFWWKYHNYKLPLEEIQKSDHNHTTNKLKFIASSLYIVDYHKTNNLKFIASSLYIADYTLMVKIKSIL